jgi:hypothetical protein
VFPARLLGRVRDLTDLLTNRADRATGIDDLLEVDVLQRLRQLNAPEPGRRPLRLGAALQRDASG